MAGYVQIVEFETSDIKAVQQALEQFRAEHPEVMRSLKTVITEDRDRPGTYLSINEFESYELAMEQSNNPLLSEFAQKMEQMTDRRFRNLDVLAELT
jgi:predicted outer membrane protein